MKIGLIIYGTLDTLSGGYLYDRQLVSYLRTTGCQVEIISLPWRSYPAHLTDNFRYTWARRIAHGGYDLLLQDELNHPSLFLLNRVIHAQSATPIISIVHHLRSAENHPARWQPLYRAVERAYLRTVDGFIFNSQTTRHIVHQITERTLPHVIACPAADHRQPPSRASVLDVINRRMHESAPLQLLFVGNLMARKGLHTVLNALARLESPEWHLHVVGSLEIDPTYSASMQQLSKHLAISSKLTWHGRLSDQSLTQLYSTCDVLVMPSYEGFGIVYLEAMSYGLPVIAANTGAAPEIVYPGINGYLVSPDDDHTLAKYLMRLQQNRIHLATLAYHARQRYDQHPTWETSMGSASLWLHETNLTRNSNQKASTSNDPTP